MLEEEQQQEIENLFEQIMKENFPNLVKETDFQEVQEAQRVPKKLDPKRNRPRYIIIKLPKIKDKERILKAARGKERVTYKRVPIRLSADFSKKNLAGKKGLERSIQSHERQGPTAKTALPAKLSTVKGQIKSFPDEGKLKKFIITKPLLYEMLKGLI